MEKSDPALDTRLLHPRPLDSTTEPLAPRLELSSVYRIRDLDHIDALYEGREPGALYARDGHPNARQLAQVLAELDGMEAALVTGSGMGAIAILMLELLQPGDRVLLGRDSYGKTVVLLRDRLSRLGIDVQLVASDDPMAAENLFNDRTKVVLLESITNPLIGVTPIDRWAELAHAHQAVLAIDSTFAPPPILRAKDCGADIVIHSLTKILSGHGDVTLGSLAGKRAIIDRLAATASTFGHHAAAMDCWLTERGLSTLSLRVERACQNAQQLAMGLQQLAQVTAVHYPGLPDHPGHAWMKEHAAGFGYMLSFELDGGRAAVNRCFQRLRLVPFCPSLGDVRTTVSHPATTSHRGLSPEERQSLGIRDGLIRVSVGVETIRDILADFAQAIE